jgi:hypothetical protein
VVLEVLTETTQAAAFPSLPYLHHFLLSLSYRPFLSLLIMAGGVRIASIVFEVSLSTLREKIAL